MANVFSLCNDVEQFLQQTDSNSRNQFIHWIKYRLNISKKDPMDQSMINTSQIFLCQCGHRYSLRFIIDEHNENDKQLYNHERLFNQSFCKRCLQFYNSNQMKAHDCKQRKIDELQSLEQLIPPDSNEQQQQQDSNMIDYVNDNETSSSSRITHFGLPKLTDSIVEIIHPDGKRQFRCPLCFNSYVNRSGLNRHYITHSSQDLWKVECQFCGKRYSRKDSLKHHMKTQHPQYLVPNWTWKDKTNESYKNLLDVEIISSSSNEKEQMENDEIVLVT